MPAEDINWQRLDKYLFHARFCRTRALACDLIAQGSIRINRQPTDKPHARLHPGDVLTLPWHQGVKIIRIRALATRRGAAGEAALLYEEVA